MLFHFLLNLSFSLFQFFFLNHYVLLYFHEFLTKYSMCISLMNDFLKLNYKTTILFHFTLKLSFSLFQICLLKSIYVTSFSVDFN